MKYEEEQNKFKPQQQVFTAAHKATVLPLGCGCIPDVTAAVGICMFITEV